MRSFNTIRLIGPICLICLIFCAGCGGLSPEAKALLSTAAVQAKESALGWKANAEKITAKDQQNAAAVELYKKGHDESLSAQAKAFADLVEAAGKGSGFQEVTKKALADAAETAQATLENYVKISEYINGDAAYLKAHGEALAAQAETLKLLSEKLKPKEKKQ